MGLYFRYSKRFSLHRQIPLAEKGSRFFALKQKKRSKDRLF